MASDMRDALAAVIGGHPGRGVRPEITTSWQRVAGQGLDPGRLIVPNIELEADGYLIRMARPIAAELASEVTAARYAVVLTDANGCVVERWTTDSPARRRLDEIFLAPGFVYSEATAGTNAIGTALVQRSPSTVEGGEHFADVLTRMACAAVPVRDPRTGRVIGALDLTCDADDAGPLMLPLVRRAAKDIERRILEDSGLAERALMQRFLEERRRTRKPFVVLNDRTLIRSAAADRLLGPGDEDLLRGAVAATDTSVTSITVTLANGANATVAIERPWTAPGVGAVLLTLSVAAPHSATDEDRPTFGLNSLTETERSVMELVAEGLTNREAAEKLLMSRHTVDFHVRSIFRKLAVASRVELTRLVLQSEPR